MGNTNAGQTNRPSDNSHEEVPIDLSQFGIPRRLKQEKDILDMSFSRLTQFPEEAFTEENRQKIRQMILWHNRFSLIPLSIFFQFRSIHKIDLSYNQLTSIPCEISLLPELKTLLLVGNKIKDWPSARDQCHNSSLTHLDLAMNKFTSFPRELLIDYASIQKLGLSRNKLSMLDFDLQTTKDYRPGSSVTDIDVSFNRLQTISPKIGRFYNLKILLLHKNLLGSIPEQIGALVHLVTLDISHNQLSSLPTSISNLASLQTLDLQSNEITSLPTWDRSQDKLSSLKRVQIQENRLSSLPECWCTLSNLQELNMTANHLTQLPNNLSTFTSLQALYLGSNHLTNLPEQISQLKLVQLFLDDNRFDSFPIQSTSADDSQTDLPIFSQLRILTLAYNHIPSVADFPFKQIKNLDILHLGGNQILDLPLELFVPTLRELYVQQNRLTKLPETQDPAQKPLLQLLRLVDLSCNSPTLTVPSWLSSLQSERRQLRIINDRHLTHSLAPIESRPQSHTSPVPSICLIGESRRDSSTTSPSTGYQWWRKGLAVGKAEMQGRRASMEDALSLYPAFQFRLLTSSSPPIPTTSTCSYHQNQPININATSVGPFPNSISVPSRFKYLKRKIAGKKSSGAGGPELSPEGFDSPPEDCCELEPPPTPPPSPSPSSVHSVNTNSPPPPPQVACFHTVSRKPSSFTRSLSLPGHEVDGALPQFLAQNVGDYFGLFDGHGGSHAAIFASQHFHRILLDSLNLQHDIESAIAQSFRTADLMLLEFFKKNTSMDLESRACCGTACLIVLIVKSVIYAANLGDSRAILCSKGKVIRLTEDHKPLEREEAARIRDAGGVVLSSGRVNGLLSVSRALGDFHLKPFGISSVPSLCSRFITPDDEFIIMACDGLWDVISEETAVEIVKTERKDPHRASMRLRDMAYLRGSSDNITVVVIIL
eukprot:TRINITY_DN10055_c0_g1_i1.p1 TRINITY_DN10055_c0_g1~~TRINITY_DN10055_c0_g1_i1.p1  ORF type:complete len:937 (+),score=204.98 TRINITY_DN10055_c0_g1_i1:130-2940(+)